MNELKTVSALVKNILIESEQARNSDNVLYLLVLKFYAERKGVNLNCVNVCDFLSYLDHKVFPAFETVRRSRRKCKKFTLNWQRLKMLAGAEQANSRNTVTLQTEHYETAFVKGGGDRYD